MSNGDEIFKKNRHKRIRWIKKIFKYMPRKATIHKYPVIGRFANSARKRSYLWSFRVTEAVPALYAGWVLTMLPVMGGQIIIACILSLLFRANIMILVALQFVSTPFTVPFLWWLDYKVGYFVTNIFGTEHLKSIEQSYDNLGLSINSMGDIINGGERVFRCFSTISLGGIICGYIAGWVSSCIYEYYANKFSTNSKHCEKLVKNNNLN
ncbi:MAG: DUF2062 domain-containing protein [Puniceicoccales bacterium]|jgi:uncharacterized protein (DUF2062 family)|nr:DUF2062 domain-containing protein [Puniceicoccales bacterium]